MDAAGRPASGAVRALFALRSPFASRCGTVTRRAGAGAAAEVRRHPRFLGRFRPHLPRRRAQEAADREGAAAGQEAREDALGIPVAGREAVRVGRREALLVHPAGQAGDGRKRAAGEFGHDAGPVPRRQGQSHPRLHGVRGRGAGGRTGRQPGVEARPQDPAAGVRLARSARRSRTLWLSAAW